MTRQCHPTSLAWRPQMSEPRIYGRSISPRKRWAVLQRFGFKCVYCGRTAQETTLEIDHVVPIARGGSNAEDNLVTACAECNMGKGIQRLFSMPLMIKARFYLEDSESDRTGYMVAGRLFQLPWGVEVLDRLGSIMLHVSILGEQVCCAKADELHDNDALDNRARYEEFDRWAGDLICPDDEDDDEDDNGEDHQLRLTEASHD
jgi:hypothetical protein